MGKGRNKILVNSLDVEKKAKKKAIRDIVLMVLFVAILLVVLNFFNKIRGSVLIIGIFIPIIVLLYIYYFLIIKVYKEQEIEKLNYSLVEGCLSTKSLTEVIPIKVCHYKEFILGLMDIAKFYAKISQEEDDYVEVWGILNQGNSLFFEKVYKGCFLEYYLIVEENKQNENE